MKAEAWAKVEDAVLAGNVEATLDALGDYFAADRATEHHPLVIELLKDAEDHCRDASFSYYASTK